MKIAERQELLARIDRELDKVVKGIHTDRATAQKFRSEADGMEAPLSAGRHEAANYHDGHGTGLTECQQWLIGLRKYVETIALDDIPQVSTETTVEVDAKALADVVEMPKTGKRRKVPAAKASRRAG